MKLCFTVTIYGDDRIGETENGKFLTQSAYIKLSPGEISPNLEDFLEMIYRTGSVPVRVKNLSEWLGVSASVASRSASSLREAGFCTFEKYGFVTLTPEGEKKGAYLVRRHRAVAALLENVCGEARLEETEKIEHIALQILNEVILRISAAGRTVRYRIGTARLVVVVEKVRPRAPGAT